MPIASEPHPTRVPRRVIAFGIIGLVVLLQTITQLVSGHEPARAIAHLIVLLVELPPLLWLLSTAYRAAARRKLGAVPMLFGGIAAASAYGAAFGAIRWMVAQHWHAFGHATFTRSVLFGAMYGQLFLGLWALAFVLPQAVDEARVRSLEAEKLRLEAEKLRTVAELARLRSHLEPHFLLNTLNAIAGLVTEEPREARRLLVCLGDLLRDALRDDDQMQPLSEQIQWLQRYAQILEARHGQSLAFRWDISEETRDVLVPRLLLQPLVENAVKHGALRRAQGGEVVVRTKLTDAGRVECVVEDNGPGMPENARREGAFGLHVVERRLALKYMDDARFRLESTSAGTRSIVLLPRREEAAAQ